MRTPNSGYIDPIATSLVYLVLCALFGVPGLIRIVIDGGPERAIGWVVFGLAAAVMLLLQGFAIAVALGEARQDALSGGVRGGLNIAPMLQGIHAPIGIAAVYVGGLWFLARIESMPIWPSIAYGGVAVGVVLGGLVAGRRGELAKSAFDRSS